MGPDWLVVHPSSVNPFAEKPKMIACQIEVYIDAVRGIGEGVILLPLGNNYMTCDGYIAPLSPDANYALRLMSTKPEEWSLELCALRNVINSERSNPDIMCTSIDEFVHLRYPNCEEILLAIDDWKGLIKEYILWMFS